MAVPYVHPTIHRKESANPIRILGQGVKTTHLNPRCWSMLTWCSNDQVRFELAFAACNPSLKVIAPWRMPEFISKFQFVLSIPDSLLAWLTRTNRGRQDLLKYAAENNIPVSSSPKAPWSMDGRLCFQKPFKVCSDL